MRETEKYVFFYKDKIAHWNMTPFKDKNGVEYNCMEQFMMATKALIFLDNVNYDNIMLSEDPAHIQQLGRYVQNFDQKIWDATKQEIVYAGNLFRFQQNKELRDILLGTGDKILAEANPDDLIWGIGMDMNDPLVDDSRNWKGENLLGEVLMDVREQLRNQSS